MIHGIDPPRNSADDVALAVDKPKKFPWPFADRTPSFVPKSIKPGPLPGAAPPRPVVLGGRPLSQPMSTDFRVRLTVAAIVALGALAFVYGMCVR